jgi:ABC-type glycerol-3-phosphate transport system substrate-binding protein
MKRRGLVLLVLMLCMSMVFSLAAGSVSAGSGERTKITYQTWNPYPEQFQPAKEAFEAANPDLEIELVMVPYTDHIQKLKIDLASGQGPDVFGLQTGATLIEFRDFLTDMTPLAAAAWGDDWESKFIPFTTALLSENGTYYALPLGVGYAGMIWADLSFFEKYSLALPGNLAELKTVAAELRAQGELFPLAIGAKDDWINLDMWMNIANDLNVEKLYSAIDGKTPFTDPDLVESFAVWQSLFADGVFQDGALGMNMYVDTTNLFEREGIVPMICNGAWTINSYPNPDPDMSAIFNGGEHPHSVLLMDWNNDGKPAGVQANVEIAVCLNKDSKNAEAAWRFVDFLMHEGQDVLINEYLMYFPSRVDLEYTGVLSDEGKGNLAKIMDWGENNVAGYRENPYPELKQSIADNLKALALGEVTPEQAASAVEAVSQAQAR